MRTFYTYEQYAEWRKSSGGAATDGIRLVGSDPSSWPGRYAAQSRIAELEAEVARLLVGSEVFMGVLSGILERLPHGSVTLDSTMSEILDAFDNRVETAWNDAIEAAASLQINGMDVVSPVAKAYILGILRR